MPQVTREQLIERGKFTNERVEVSCPNTECVAGVDGRFGPTKALYGAAIGKHKAPLCGVCGARTNITVWEAPPRKKKPHENNTPWRIGKRPMHADPVETKPTSEESADEPQASEG